MANELTTGNLTALSLSSCWNSIGAREMIRCASEPFLIGDHAGFGALKCVPWYCHCTTRLVYVTLLLYAVLIYGSRYQ
jgi:hypothetical protein